MREQLVNLGTNTQAPRLPALRSIHGRQLIQHKLIWERLMSLQDFAL